MNAKTKALFDARARIIKAIAHPSRLFMVDELSRGERCVCELTEMVGADISTVSKHLALLKKAGIVTDRKEGLQVYYRLKTPCIMRFFECVESVQEANAAERKVACCARK
jgi:ArsR family transcriptional regulator